MGRCLAAEGRGLVRAGGGVRAVRSRVVLCRALADR